MIYIKLFNSYKNYIIYVKLYVNNILNIIYLYLYSRRFTRGKDRQVF